MLKEDRAKGREGEEAFALISANTIFYLIKREKWLTLIKRILLIYFKIISLGPH